MMYFTARSLCLRVHIILCIGYICVFSSSHARIIFKDSFNESSRGERLQNIVSEPPPVGLGYTTDTPYGYVLKNWHIYDYNPGTAIRSFWCIPEGQNGVIETFMRQAGRSANSVAYPKVPIPVGVTRYRIEFRQWCHDNDYIGFIIGAKNPYRLRFPPEFGYERQLPGTDDTVNDIYYEGIFGDGIIKGKANIRQWAQHRIEVDNNTIQWYQNDELLIGGEYIPDEGEFSPDGYFGIRMTFDRGTRYDDVRIVIPEPGWDFSTMWGWMYSFDDSGWTYLRSFNAYVWLDNLGPTLADLGGFWTYFTDVNGAESTGGQLGELATWAYTDPAFWTNDVDSGTRGWIYLIQGLDGERNPGWYQYMEDMSGIFIKGEGANQWVQVRTSN